MDLRLFIVDHHNFIIVIMEMNDFLNIGESIRHVSHQQAIRLRYLWKTAIHFTFSWPFMSHSMMKDFVQLIKECRVILPNHLSQLICQKCSFIQLPEFSSASSVQPRSRRKPTVREINDGIAEGSKRYKANLVSDSICFFPFLNV